MNYLFPNKWNNVLFSSITLSTLERTCGDLSFTYLLLD